VVAGAEAAARDFPPAMRFQRDRARNAHRRAISDDPVVEDGDEATFGEIVDLAADFAGGVSREVFVAAAHEIDDSLDVGEIRLADFEPRLFLLGYHLVLSTGTIRPRRTSPPPD